MTYTYRRIIRPEEHAEIYRRLRDEDLLWCLFSEVEPDEWSEDFYLKMHGPEHARETWLGYVDGQPAGVAYFWPFQGSWRTRCAELGVCAFRSFFKPAARLARGCLIEAMQIHGRCIKSFIGRVPCPNRHVLNMLGTLGFQKKFKIPELFWYTKLHRHVDGWIVHATCQDIKATWEVE